MLRAKDFFNTPDVPHGQIDVPVDTILHISRVFSGASAPLEACEKAG